MEQSTTLFNFLTSPLYFIYCATFHRQNYIKKVNIFSDQKKFTTVNLKDDALLNFAIKQEKHVDKVL